MEPSPTQVPKKFTCDGNRKNGSPCKAELDTEMKFCGKCGKKISKPRVCVGKNRKDGSPCGFVVAADFDFCPECGTEVPEEEKETPEKEYCTGKKKDGALCQAEKVPGKNVCGKCGTSYETAGADTIESQVPQKEAEGKETNPESSGASHQPTGVDDGTKSHTDQPVSPSDTTAGEPDGTPKQPEDEKEDPESTTTTESGNIAEEQTNASTSQPPGDSAVKDTTAKGHQEGSQASPGSGATHDAKLVETPIQRADHANAGAEPSKQPEPGAQGRTPYSEVTKRGLQETPQKREPEEKQPPQEISHSVGSVSGMVDVVFKVIISKEFDFKSDVHEALVMLGPTFDANHSALLNFVRDTTVGPLVCGTVPMSIDERNHGFYYKYLIRKRDPKKHAASSVWEHLESDYKDVIVNRTLRVPEKDKIATGEYIAYDGIIYPKPGWGFIQNVVNYIRNTYKHDAQAAVDEFLPAHENIRSSLLDPALDPKKTAESYLDTIDRIVSTLPYPFTISKIHAQEKKLIVQGVEKKLVAPLLEVIENCEKGTRLTSTLAIFLLKLCNDHSVELQAKQANLLCRAMRIAPDVNKKIVPEMEHLKVHFPAMMQDKKRVAQHLIQLIEKSGSPKTDCSWLHCVPLLHFLEDASQPFEEMTPNANVAANQEWWGIGSVLERKQSFKRAWNDNKHKENKDIITTVAQLEPLFKADALLSRTLVACLGYQQLLTVLLKCTIPLEVMGAILALNIKTRGTTEQTKETEELLLDVIRKMAYMWREESNRECTEQGLKLARCQVQITVRQFKIMLDKREYFQQDLTRCMIHVMFLALDRLACAEERICPESREKEWNQHAEHCATEACVWNDWICVKHVSLYAQHRREKLSKNLMSWVKLLEQTDGIKHDGLRRALISTIAGLFEKCFEKSSPADKLSMFLSNGKPIQAFREILNRLAFASLEQAFKESENFFKAEVNAELDSLLSDVLVMKWEEQVPDTDAVLEFTVTWAPMVHYLNKSTNKDNKAGKMNEKAAGYITQAMTEVSNAQASLMEGKIRISTLKFLIKNEKQFCDVCEFSGTKRTMMASLLNLRKHEMEAYERNGEYIGKLFEYCREYLKTEDAQEVKRCIDNLRVESFQLRLSDVCEIAPRDTKQRLAAYKPKANPWQLPDEVLDVLSEFENKISSKIFCKLLSMTAASKGTDLTSTSFWRAFLILWKDVMTEWESVCAKMIDGSMTIAETLDTFRMFSSKDSSYNFGALREELLKIAGKGSQGWVDDRIRQFKSFTEIKQHVEAADLMLQMREAYHMEDGFEDIEKIYNLSQNEHVAIHDMDEGVRALCTQLEDLTPHNITCLKGFLEPRSQQFLTWIRTTMKGGLKELKVFVDLAFISAGEEPYAVDTVNCFHTTAIGYAPLIFMTAGDKGFGYLLEQIKIVFGNIENDPKLYKKLADISPKLEWFQDIQKSHGSVEKTAMTQVGNINARGVFKVGSVKNRGMDVARVIQLDVMEDTKGQNPPRRYTYNELLDLQSRLMLVAGQADKGKEDVVRFITIMDSMVRLGKKYVQLSEDGCILFLDWSVNFLCDTSSPVCCTSEFSGHEMLKGHRSMQDLEDFIAGVASFLEKCHNEWLDYVDRKRKEYPEFNYYLIKQLVFLQQELVKVGGNVSKYVYPLLSLIKSDCTPQDVEQACDEAMDEVERIKQQQHGQHEEIAQKEDKKKGMKDKTTKFLKEMKDADIPRHKALKALKAVGPDDPEEGLLWCMEHECDEEDPEYAEAPTEEEEEEKKEVGQRITELLSTSQSIGESAVMWLKAEKDTGEDTLQAMIGNLSLVWKKFLESVGSGFQDFLSMEHLGIILRCLAKKDGRALKRTLPPVCKAGSPNLILCPKTEVLNAVTCMYMFPAESETPLPQPDEVLMCTDTTTFQEVDIFLRRAIFDHQHNKVHCLAFADSLPYDVGDMAEKRIKEYHNQTENDYQLVVICTSENEYRSHMVAALQRFHRPTRDVFQSNQVCKYLTKRFSGVIQRQDRESASSLDPESLSVRVIRSNRSGVGKTLYKERLTEKLKKRYRRVKKSMSVSIPLHCRVADTTSIATLLLEHTLEPDDVLPRIIHLDISYQVLEGVDHLLFNLLVMGCVSDAEGRVWLRSPMDLYIVETMPLYDQQKDKTLVHQIFHILPSLKCWSPNDSLTILQDASKIEAFKKHDQLFDDLEFRSEVYQRPFQYLKSLEEKKKPSPFQPDKPYGEKADCLATLLKYCGVNNPSWSELAHFVSFLNKQLQDFEFNHYCNMAVDDDLPGFSTFVLRFLVQMSRDFATRSLNVSEQSLAALETLKDNDETNIELYQMRRTWETSPHPYIFFNPDRHTMTFLGFSVNKHTGALMDQQTKRVLEKRIIGRELFDALELNGVPLSENFDDLEREERLRRLYRVFGVDEKQITEEREGQMHIIDPDETYELTTDNVKKILAIYMRFRCNIPVIVMGETGCGKTRLVKFLCALQTPKQKEITTMVLVKVHGGTTANDIQKKVHQAEMKARENAAIMKAESRPIYTVLFFDEANTTEAVGAIKEVMCDGTMNGQPITLNKNLKMVACCNPYRKHSEELIGRLENAGLGYHVDADKTIDKLGRVPMRWLVYRVQPLPQSMLPLVWDFGQLSPRMEELYIRQMVRRYVAGKQLRALDEGGLDVICRILIESQQFMRQQKDECSFVSLRDVERALTVTSWFYRLATHKKVFYTLLEEELKICKHKLPSRTTIALVLSLGVCYRACLGSITELNYDKNIVQFFRNPLTLPGGVEQFRFIISKCQDILLSNVRLEENIACNQALKENVFMMVVCIELRIPLFLVGKPGSSKSLAKTIVSDAMQGTSAHSDLFRQLKQAQMVSFQCSPLATAEGIQSMFRQCARYQKNKNMDTFVSVVVLDEVGLAEDSPKMALKTLHPLLEDGYTEAEKPEDYAKVAFVGISNWALDPAKMNRGLHVQRDVPNEDELHETAKGICSTKNESTMYNVIQLIPKLAEAYLAIFKEAKQKREFFGLRDFYSLVKMVYGFAARSGKPPTHRELIASVKRNFGGLDIDPMNLFKDLIPAHIRHEEAQSTDPDCTPSGLIKAALNENDTGGESRYLLLLTENYGGLSILTERLLADHRVVPIFGSSFPRDQEYTKICTNINRVKVCMETGQTVILLNLENLYESLYDALNQYYAMLGGERYVDLGLGTHRVKCRVHRQFRLVVVAEKDTVYEKFPIPLINRLEKHFLTVNNIMTEQQIELARQLETWATDFVKTDRSVRYVPPGGQQEPEDDVAIGDVFMGFHVDTAPAIVLKVWDKLQADQNPEILPRVLEESKRLLLWCATPDAVVRSREVEWNKVYYEEQKHEDLAQYLRHQLREEKKPVIAQVTTHCRLLTDDDRVRLCGQLSVGSITLLTLQAFETEQQFNQQIRAFFAEGSDQDKILIIQSESGDVNKNLVKCAQYCVQDQMPENSTCFHIVFIVQLPRIAGGCYTGFLGGSWHCLHIDELRTPDTPFPPATQLESQTPATLIAPPVHAPVKERPTKPKERENDDTEEGALDVEGVEDEVQDEDAMEGDPEWEQPQGFSPEYVRELLISCVQAAVALVDKRGDEQDIDARATRRISLMLNLMRDNDDFAIGIHKMVWHILKKKEARLANAEKWLTKEAARLESVQKAGTFRRAWAQCLENKVIPVLACIVAYLDSCANLDLLQHTQRQADAEAVSCIEHAWLNILQHVCNVNYDDLRTHDTDDLEEFTVPRPAAGNVPFVCKLPFPWIVWETVNTVICEAKRNHTGGAALGTAGSFMVQRDLGQCLDRAVGQSEKNKMHIFNCYISDMLLFAYKLSEAEHELFQQCVHKGLLQLDMNLTQLEVGRGLVSLHWVLDQMKPRLEFILDMNDRRPSSVVDLQKINGAGAQLLAVADEMTEDVAMLMLLLEDLQPDLDKIKEKDGIRDWMGRFSKVAPVIMRVLNSTSYLTRPQPVGDGQTEQDQLPESAILPPDDTLPFGKESRKTLKLARIMWTRILAVRLFLDYMNPLRTGPEMTRKAMKFVSVALLWKLLESLHKDENVTQKQLHTFRSVDRFLKSANGHMIKGLLGEVSQCMFCEKDLTRGPIELPCKHRICHGCYMNWCPKTRPGQCPQCRMEVPQDFDHTDCEYWDAVEQLHHYQRQTSGFLMALVSQLCFGGHENPEPEAVSHIINQYIMHESEGKTLIETKHMTVQDDIVDPTPVLRTYLLRLLLKYEEQEVKELLQNNLLKKYQKIIDQVEQENSDRTSALVELSLLVIFCVEDLMHESEAATFGELAHARNPSWLKHIASVLHSLRPHLSGPAEQLTTLESIGQLRYVLDAVVRVIQTVFFERTEKPVISKELKDLFQSAQEICSIPGVAFSKKYLIKKLCREQGVQAYTDLDKIADDDDLLKWISLEEFTIKFELASDMFLTVHEVYKILRDCLRKILYSADSTELMQILQDLEIPADRLESLLLLSLHRATTEIKMQKLPEQQSNEMRSNLANFVQDCNVIKDKDLAHQLLRGTLWSRQSPLYQALLPSTNVQSTENVLLHVKLVFEDVGKQSRLLKPLHALAFNPHKMVSALLPTMPQDDFAELLRAVDAGGEGATVWRCRCGYRFIVGDCGNVVESYKRPCPRCGGRFGGEDGKYNVPVQGTTRDAQGTDETKTGHVLGNARSRPSQGVPERNLNMVQCAFTRFFTHAALFIAANSPNQLEVLSRMIQPRIAEDDVCQFFWDHLRKDLEVLQTAIGCTPDDTCLLLHHMCTVMTQQEGVEGDLVSLATKKERMEWEEEFSMNCLEPTLKDMVNVTRRGNKLIVADASQDETQLLNMVHEIEDTETGQASLDQLLTNPAVWRYRPHIHVDNFFRQFRLHVEAHRDMDSLYPVIRLFKEESQVLRALHYVPAILAGQRRLISQLYRRLDRSEAAKLYIGGAKDKKECEGLSELLENFTKAWEIVKERLIAYPCLAPFDEVVYLPAEFHNVIISEESPLAVLLPSTSGPGLCSYILMQFLLSQHNDFMKSYCNLLKRRGNDDWYTFNNLPEVSAGNIRERHVVSYTAESLLPLVLANCNYSLTVGNTATLDYDFETFEKQLQDSVLDCKSRVSRHQDGYIEIATMVYKVDATSSRLFKIIRDKIKQECLSPAQRRQIKADFRGSLPAICESIENLNTALSFLKALGGDPFLPLHDFMAFALQMKTTILSRKAQEHASLKHVQSLWIFLCFERASILAAHGQNAFDFEVHNLREDLNAEQRVELEEMCKKMSVDRLELLLLQIFECIMLRLSQPRDQDDATNPAHCRLLDELMVNLSDCPFYEEEPAEVKSGMLTAEDLVTHHFPESLCGRHAASTWLICRDHFAQKRK